jgi:MATE family multidrug resistance protein
MNTVDITYRRIARITSPVLVTHLSYTAMGVMDTIMVGQLGVVALGAVGLGNLVGWWLLSFFWGMLSGVNTLVAQAEGAGDRPAAGVVFWQGVHVALAAGALIAMGAALVPMIFAWVDAPPATQALAAGYMRIRLLGAVGLMLLLAADNFYRGLGRTDVPMWCGVGQLLLNCALNYVLIFGKLGLPPLGTAGAALGTVIAQFLVGLVLLASILLGPHVGREFAIRRSWHPHPGVLLGLLRLSVPIGVQVFMEMGGITVFGALVARLGEAEMAATNAVIQAWSVAFMAAFALGVGATTLVGQSIGARQESTARRVVGRIQRIGYTLTALVGLVYVWLPEQLMALFVSADERAALLPFARPLFTVVVLCLFFDLKFNILAGALRGAGDTAYPMWINIASVWLLFVPATILVTPRFGLTGAWSCLILHVVVLAVCLELRFRGRAWLKPALGAAHVLARAA